jgi:hypothetical protein
MKLARGKSGHLGLNAVSHAGQQRRDGLEALTPPKRTRRLAVAKATSSSWQIAMKTNRVQMQIASGLIGRHSVDVLQRVAGVPSGATSSSKHHQKMAAPSATT